MIITQCFGEIISIVQMFG